MRANDHQIQMALVISTLATDAPMSILYKGKDLGVGFKTDGVVARADTSLPTTCQMERPN